MNCLLVEKKTAWLGHSWFLRHNISSSQKGTHAQKSHQTQSSISFSLSSDEEEEEEEDKEERGGSIRFVSDLRYFPLVLVIGRV